MPISNFPNGFSKGVNVQGLPLLNTYGGNVFWVDSGAGSDGNKGTFDRPFATLDYAVGRCTASNGDIIMIKAGHAETLSAADAIDLDVIGISVIGLGTGSLRPTFTMDNAAGEITFGADNILLENVIVNASVTAVLKAINVEDGVNYATIRGCTFGVDAAGTDEFNHTISFANNNTGCVVEGNTIDMGIAGAVAAIILDADTDKVVIQNNIIRGDYSTANIMGDTTLSTNVLIQNNLLENGIGGDLNAQPCIELLTGTYGTIANNYIVCNLATKVASIVADTCLLFENYYNEDIQGTGGLIGTVSADD